MHKQLYAANPDQAYSITYRRRGASRYPQLVGRAAGAVDHKTRMEEEMWPTPPRGDDDYLQLTSLRNGHCALVATTDSRSSK